MKSLKKIFKGLMGKVDHYKIENYYGHGTHKHDDADYSHIDENEHHPDIKYKCPMKCEGDKTYDEQGNCPVCNMKLMPVDDKASVGHH